MIEFELAEMTERLVKHKCDDLFILKKVIYEKIQETERFREMAFPAKTQDELLMRYETLTELLNIVELIEQTKQQEEDNA